MEIKADMKGGSFRKKLRNLQSMNYMFQQLPGHVAGFLMDEVVNDELNYGYDGQHIGRPSGKLAGSLTLDVRPYRGSFRINGDGSAPYAEKVSDWARNRYGSNPKEHVLARSTEGVMQTVAAEWKRAVKTIERGGNYTYDNPFYSI